MDLSSSYFNLPSHLILLACTSQIVHRYTVGVKSLSPVNMILPFIDIQYIFTQHTTILYVQRIRIYITGTVGIDYTILAK